MTPLIFAHVLISLAGIISGAVVLLGLLNSQRLDRWTSIFLTTTVATSVTGFLLPFDHFMPSHAIGIVSLMVLAVAIGARYVFHLNAAWRKVYVFTAVLALYLNVFVLIAQLFQKVPFLKAMAPTQSEPPFLVAQLLVLVAFVALAIRAASRFHAVPLRAA